MYKHQKYYPGQERGNTVKKHVQKKITALLRDAHLPAMSDALRESREMASGVGIGRTLFMEKFDVSSELEYKRRCIKEGRIMYHAHIGMNTWPQTVSGLRALYSFAERNGFIMDRAGICIDRRMALPKDIRKSAPQESGPYLETSDDWAQIGRVVPIQPHMGDFMIGFPASAENTLSALNAGVTTIGNLSQFFAHEAPAWKRMDVTTVETVKALGIMGYFREQGVLAHSYLDDGFGALFLDSATTAAWAYMEKYIIEDLLGAKIAHCTGGLVSNPIKRSGWIFALDEIHDHDCIGSMFYGDTISASKETEKNRALTFEYLIWDIMTQMECPTGHAVLPVPLTEALRTPSADDICEVQLLGREAEKIAGRLRPHFNFAASKQFARSICARGREIFNSALDLLQESGVDTRDAVKMLYVLKTIGARDFEDALNPKAKTDCKIDGELSASSDIFLMTLELAKKWEPLFAEKTVKNIFSGRKILLASTDVHEHGVLLIEKLLQRAGADLTAFGAERNPDEVASRAAETSAEAILVSTHNGMALEYARKLLGEMARLNLDIPVCMGGILNQNTEAGHVPADVVEELEAMGINTIPDIGGLPERAAQALQG